MAPISKQTSLVPRSSVRFRAMPAGGMLVNLATGACFELNRVGADLWTSLAAGSSVGTAIDTLSKAYDAPADVIQDDALRLCGDLVAAGLLDALVESRGP